MKKLIAILLALVCVFSCMSVSAYAAEDIEDIIGDILDLPDKGEQPEDKMQYGIHYEVRKASFVKVTYKPKPDITFKVPKTMKVTSDMPLSVDYQFVCWEDENGKYYFAGDEIYVENKVVLYAVWEEKPDDVPRFIRAIQTGIQTLMKLFQRFLGIVDIVEDFDESYYETTTGTSTDAPSATEVPATTALAA